MPTIVKILILTTIALTCDGLATAQRISLPQVGKVPKQPLLAQVNRLDEALQLLGNPLRPELLDRLNQLKEADDESQITITVQQLLDPLCLFAIETTPGGPPTLHAGNSDFKLIEQGWRTFLVKVINPTASTGRIRMESPNAAPLPHAPPSEVGARWMKLSHFEGQPMRPNLSGLELEYRIVQIYSRDAGTKQAVLDVEVSGESGEEDGLIRQWRFQDGVDGWYPMNKVELQASAGALQVQASGDDPFMGTDIAAKSGPMVLRFWAKTEQDGVGQLFWWTADRPDASGDRSANFLLEPGKEHLYEVAFNSRETVTGLRIDSPPQNRWDGTKTRIRRRNTR